MSRCEVCGREWPDQSAHGCYGYLMMVAYYRELTARYAANLAHMQRRASNPLVETWPELRT